MAVGAVFGAAGGVSGSGYSQEYGSVMGDNIPAESLIAWGTNQLAIGCLRGLTNQRLRGAVRPY